MNIKEIDKLIYEFRTTILGDYRCRDCGAKIICNQVSPAFSTVFIGYVYCANKMCRRHKEDLYASEGPALDWMRFK